MRYLNKSYQTTGVETAVILGWVAAGTAAAGAVYAGYTAKQTANFNADMAMREANYQKSKGEMEEKQHLDRLKKQMAEGKVAVAKSGVSLMSGSAQDVFDENLEEGLFDAVMIRYGSEATQSRLIGEANSQRYQGNAAMTAGTIKAGSTLLTQAAA